MNKLLILAAVVAAGLAQSVILPPDAGIQPVFPDPSGPIESQPAPLHPDPPALVHPMEPTPQFVESEPFFPAGNGEIDPRAVPFHRSDNSGSHESDEEERFHCNCPAIGDRPRLHHQSDSHSHEHDCNSICGRPRFQRALLERMLRGIPSDGRDGGRWNKGRKPGKKPGGWPGHHPGGRSSQSSSSSESGSSESHSHSHEHGYDRRRPNRRPSYDNRRPAYGNRRPSYDNRRSGYNWYPQQSYWPQSYYPSYGYGYNNNQVRDIFQGRPVYGWQNWLSSPWAVPQYNQGGHHGGY